MVAVQVVMTLKNIRDFSLDKNVPVFLKFNAGEALSFILSYPKIQLSHKWPE